MLKMCWSHVNMNVVLVGAAVSCRRAVYHVTKLASTLLRGCVHSHFGFQLCSDDTAWFTRGSNSRVQSAVCCIAPSSTAYCNSYNQILTQPESEKQTES